MQINGRAYFEDGRPAAGVPLRFVHIGFGGASTTLGGTDTGADGSYSITITTDITAANLQIVLAETTKPPIATTPTVSGLPAVTVAPPVTAPPVASPPVAAPATPTDVTTRMDPDAVRGDIPTTRMDAPAPPVQPVTTRGVASASAIPASAVVATGSAKVPPPTVSVYKGFIDKLVAAKAAGQIEGKVLKAVELDIATPAGFTGPAGRQAEYAANLKQIVDYGKQSA